MRGGSTFSFTGEVPSHQDVGKQCLQCTNKSSSIILDYWEKEEKQLFVLYVDF